MWGTTLKLTAFNDFFQINDEQDLETFRKRYGASEKDVNEKIVYLFEWAQSHPWLPKEAQDFEFLAKMLRASKFDTARSKRKMEGFFQAVTIYPEVFKNLGNFKVCEQIGTFLISPVRTPNAERVLIFRLNPDKLDDPIDYETFTLIAATLAVVLVGFDCNNGIRVIYDFQHATFQHFTSFKFSTFFKLKDIFLKCVSLRIRGIEIINSPPFLKKVVNLMKSLLGSPKLSQRIYVHQNMESLAKTIPKTCLPSDYGGQLSDLRSWLALWDDFLKEFHELFVRIADMEAVNFANDDLDTTGTFGAQGCFQKLSID